ncbi:MAG: Na/Pi cotransporter family protein [Sedimentisphaerales bacterium]|nr:Na/Pi cotransporter family protein [Sedimentisphaerales bacterium]
MNLQLGTQIGFGVVGGLGIFLLGMKNMSEGMQAVAGEKIRKLIKAVTDNRLIGCGVGTAITCLIQSSSVTTVMVVGMVNASLMTLQQAIGVILGANIGTTITGWILVLKIGHYGLPLLGISAFFFLFSKRERVRYIATMFLGLGMVFFGLELMKTGFAPLKEIPEFERWFSRFTPDGYFGVMKCCLVGAALTAIVQSSSATIGITMGLAATGVIQFPTAAALVLGENIGTTVTALLASIGASTNAKRAAYAHTVINILGVLWITTIFHLYLSFIQWIVGVDPATPVVQDGVESFPYAMRAIAATHSGFNITNAIIFMPLVTVLARLLVFLAPEKKYVEVPHLKFLDVRMLDAPVIGIQQSQKEILRMGEEVEQMLSLLKLSQNGQDVDKRNEERIFELEKHHDLAQKEIVEFLGNLMTGTVPHDVMERGRKQLRMADEYESISDYITNILKLILKTRNTNQQMTVDGLREVLDLHGKVAEYIHFVNLAVQAENKEILPAGLTQAKAITHLMKKYRSAHLDRVESGLATPLLSLIYTDMLNAYRRIKDHAFNIVEILAGEK